MNLKEITINQYIGLLAAGNDVEQLTAIDSAISAAMNSGENIQDLNLFFLQKDLLKLQCRAAIAFLSRDSKSLDMFNKKISALMEELAKKTKDKKPVDPYENFIGWLLQVEKYAGHAIDKENSLAYLILATKQMIKYYESQIEQRK